MAVKKIKMGLVAVSLFITSVPAIEITSTVQAVDIAGKQRMFTQHMLKDYAMVGRGNTFGKPGEDLKKIAETFEDHFDSLTKLKSSNLNTDEINGLLAKVKRSFMFSEIMDRSKSKFVSTLIYKKSNDILLNMNSVTQKYVELKTK